MRSHRHSSLLVGSVILACLLAAPAMGAQTRVQYLSGKGKDDAVNWDFICNAGMNANKPSTINVPSNWELQGFGIYSYGTDRNPNGWPKVQGKYKRTFTVPAEWKELQTSIVFEGVMTDAQVLINGQSAGPVHQGGYYRFKYDISKLLKAGENTVEVIVDDESADGSVNRAERRGDYWNYAGIFRPVYLEAVPTQNIERVAVDAKADGEFGIDVVTVNNTNRSQPLWVRAQILDMDGKPVGTSMSAPAAGGSTHLATKIANPKTWNAETPNLYTVQVDVGGGQSQLESVIHTVKQKFGFRTIEARAGEGLFVNGQRIILKGADRHSFWPDSGRCLSEQISHDDIAVMKEMNMNAVRMSHYPPDQHFLDACDEMGMYVLDELAGWHAKYDDGIGHTLVEAMVKRDVNHPSIIFWDNGNEGGWNNNLNDDFAKWDPQKRNVLHPWELFRGIDTKHYPDYTTFAQKAAGNNVFFPTEFLHGLYDGGHGAGLDDYWKVVMKSKVAAGGILWSLVDEDVKRTDKGGILDSKGNQGPDGILGPYREKEGSYYTVKELWSPIVVTREGGFIVQNRYSFTDARDCSYTMEMWNFNGPTQPDAGHKALKSIQGVFANSVPPGTSGEVGFFSPAPTESDASAITAKDPHGRELWTWVFPNKNINRYRTLPDTPAAGKVQARESSNAIVVFGGDLALSFNKQNGTLTTVSRGEKPFHLNNGPRLVGLAPTLAAARGQPAVPASEPLPESRLTSLTQKADGNDIVVTATYEAPSAPFVPATSTGQLKTVTTRIRPNGWITIDYTYTTTGTFEYLGVGFDLPTVHVQSMRYLGDGPSTVYKNRLAGGTLDVWEKKNNYTIVGDPDKLAAGERFDYPIFKGFYSGVRWMTLQTTAGPVTALVNQDDLFVQVLQPDLPPAGIQANTAIAIPKAGLAFLHAIPAMGSKFAKGNTTGPQGQPFQAAGEYRGSVSIYLGELK